MTLIVSSLLISAFALATLAGCNLLNRKPKELAADLSEYVTLSFEGPDTVAKASVNFDDSSLVRELMSDKDHMYFLSENKDKLDDLVDSISISLSKDEGLSNGDVISYEVTFDKDLATELAILFEKMDDVVVEGLIEITDYNPFDDVTLSFIGDSPYLQVGIEYSCSLDRRVDVQFATDKKYYARGETVVVTATYSEEDALQYSYVKVTQSEKEYTAESDYEYITDAATLLAQTEMFNYIYESFQVYVTAELADATMWKEIPEHVTDTPQQAGDITIDSAYLLVTMDEAGIPAGADVCTLVLIMNVPMSYVEDPDANIDTRYVAVTLPNLQIDADNKLFVAYSNLSLGFPKEDRVFLYDQYITENIKDYTVIEIPVADLPVFPSLTGATETAVAETTAAETSAAN